VRQIRPSIAIAVGFAASLSTLAAGQNASAPEQRRAYTSTATAILVDVVGRDKHGRPVTNLSATDFEVLEDGVRQKIDSFTRISHGTGIGVGVAWKRDRTTTEVKNGAAAAPPTRADDEEGTTALVFDHLSAESLKLAQRATLDYIPKSGEASTRVGVFATEPGVRVLQRYTTDRSLVRQAVERVLPTETAAEEQRSDRTDELVARRRELAAQNQGAGSVGQGAAIARNAQDISERDMELQLIRTELDMLRADSGLDRAHKGHNTAQALLAIVQSLAQFPGRKTIVFFSEGLPVSPALSARLDWVIDMANGANITAYAVDANGLLAKCTIAVPKKEMDAFAEERLTQLGTGTDRTDQPLTMALERVEDTIRLDSRTGLARLAEQTGGFLIEGSNDLSSAFRRIDEDNQFHYLLSYSPRNSSVDGKYRAIQIKVQRSGVEVFARKGYRALGSVRSSDTGAYEAPAVALLDRTPLPNAFPVHAAAFSFPEASRPGLTPVVVHVATDAFRYNVDSQRSTYSGQAAIVVRIRDAGGREVQKLSQQYLLSGDAKDLGAARHGDIIFYREVDLPPGLYTMETIVFDAASRQGSARVGTLNGAREDSSGLRMSSLVLVNRAEEIKDAAADRGPLYVGQTLLYPNLGEPITKSNTSELPFYFALYGDVSGARAVAQLLRNGLAVAEAPVELPPATASRVQQVSRLPIASLPAGTYELRIRVMHKGQELSRSAFFTLQD
jgi:VWFA-related protein